MSTIRQVAENAGVSIATVSRVVNNNSSVSSAVRAKVLKAVNHCGYVPSVSRRSTSFLALVYASPIPMASSYEVALIGGIGHAMTIVDFDLVFLNPFRDRAPDETFTQYFLRKGARGVILRSTVTSRSICEQIAEEDFPSIVVGDHFEHPSLSFVYADSTDTSKQAVQHLLSLGHRCIAFAANPFDDGDHVDRYRGYCVAIEESGLNVDQQLIYRVQANLAGGAQLLRNMMSSARPPTAVYITDPSIAVGLLNEARSMGIEIPRDLSLVGFDDGDTRDNVFPRMTSVCQNAYQMGQEAFVQLARMVKSGEPPKAENHVSLTWLEINRTTAPPLSKPLRVLPDGTRLENSLSEIG